MPYCVSVLLLTSGCKSAPAQYKCHYYLTPPQSLSRKQIKTKLMLFKPFKSYTAPQNETPQLQKCMHNEIT